MFNIETVEDLVWVDAENTRFNCLVKYTQFDEKLPSTIVENDGYAHIAEIWQRALAGEFGAIAEYIAPEMPKTVEAK